MSEPSISPENVRAMLTENLARVRKANDDYFQMLEKGLSSSQLPVSDQAKHFADLFKHNVAATFDFCDRLIKANNPQEAMQAQSEFFQSRMRDMTEQARSMGESAMKAMTGAFTRKD
jgi:phasin